MKIRPERWPAWVPLAAAAWGVLYAAVQATWAATGTIVPLRPQTPYPPSVQLTHAALAVAATVACLASTRTLGRTGRVVVGSSLAVLFVMFVLGMTTLPLYFVTLASGAGMESATGLANVLMNTAGAGLIALVGVTFRRRTRGQCTRCGQAHPGPGDGPLVHPGPSTASRRTRVAVYLLMCGILPWAGVKTIWTLGGDALGVTAQEWHDVNEIAPGSAKALAAVGIDITVLAAMLAIFLMLGLMYRWGQVWPRWTMLLAGRRVPRLLPLIPAWLTAAGLAVYGVLLTIYAPLSAVGVLPSVPSADGFSSSAATWMAEFGGLAFAGLGIGLIVAARSYVARTRPVCAVTPRRSLHSVSP